LRELGLSIPQFDLLSALLQQEGQSQQDIAERLFVTKGNVSGLVDRLAGAGLVERRATAGDRRSHALFLTAAGRKLAESGMRTHETYVSDTLGRLPPADRASLERLLMAWRDTVRAEAERAPQRKPA
jgi:DNA-binding MarR family transcriptional regulator